MRLSMEEVKKQHESTKKLYEQGLTVAPVDIKRVLDLYDTIEVLQQENEQLQAQNAAMREEADVIIRILDYCGKENIDIDYSMKLKMEFNKTRPYKHGGKVI